MIYLLPRPQKRVLALTVVVAVSACRRPTGLCAVLLLLL